MAFKLIRYQTRPESIEENRSAIAEVFAQLGDCAPKELRYGVLQLGDGTFLHLVDHLGESGPNPLAELSAFKRFTAGVGARQLVPAVTSEARLVGNYRVFEN